MRNRIDSSDDESSALSLGSWSTNSSNLDSACGIHRVNALIEHQVQLFGPERYESRYDYPLVVWLHSCHSSEAELEAVMCGLSLQNYVGCAPRAPIPSDRGLGRFVWGSSANALAVAEEIVFAGVDLAAQQFSICRRKIFIAGFGSGATMAWRLALRYPEHFAGVVAICGGFPNEQRSLVRLNSARKLPVLWMYGQDSRNCNIQQVCETLPLLHAASLAVDIRQYPCGDELLSNMLTDSNIWLMEQVTDQPHRSEAVEQETFSRN